MIDTHCHLEREVYHDLDKIIEKMQNNIIIVSGYNFASNKEVIELINKYPNVYGTIGVHPENIEDAAFESMKFIEDNISNPKIVGIGEIGLDYHFDKEHKEKQKELFIKQLNLAHKYQKTVVIHSRDAIKDTYDILKEHLKTKAILHCYSSSTEMAYKFKEMNIKFGIGGVLTFKNSKELKEVVKNLPLTDLLLETDSPYLTPEPYRGKRNEPYNIILVAEKIAEIKNISLEDVLNATTSNAVSQFDLPIKV